VSVVGALPGVLTTTLNVPGELAAVTAVRVLELIKVTLVAFNTVHGDRTATLEVRPANGNRRATTRAAVVGVIDVIKGSQLKELENANVIHLKFIGQAREDAVRARLLT